MYVDAAKLRKIQHIGGQNFAVGNHDNQFRTGFLKQRQNRAVLQGIRLMHSQSVLKRKRFDRRRRQLHFASLRFIRLGQNADNLMPVCNETRETRHRKVRRTHKQDSHSSSTCSTSTYSVTFSVNR